MNQTLQSPTPQLTITEAAKQLGVCANTIRKWITSGELKAYRYGTDGRIVRIKQSDLDNLGTPAARGAAL